MNVIIYHANCLDGFAAMLAAVDSFSDKKNIVAIPSSYGDLPPQLEKEDDVFILDFSYPRSVLLDIQTQVNSITLLDHHETAMRTLHGLDFVKFDLTKSGSVSSWEYFHPNEPIPLLFKYIQAYDFGKDELGTEFYGSTELCVFLQSLEYSIPEWVKMIYNSRIVEKGIKYGGQIRDYKRSIVRQIVNTRVSIHNFGGYKRVPIVNCDEYLSKDIASHLFQQENGGYPLVVTYFDDKQFRNFRLKSSISEIDVSHIAEQFGGGGHRHRSGFRIPLNGQKSILT